MCGRFSLEAHPEVLAQAFSLASAPPLAPRKNICPTQPVLAIRQEAPGRREAVLLEWGLIPQWMKTPPSRPMINARSETLTEKPSFKSAFRHRRCLIPASGYYEWRTEERGKQAYHFTLAQGGVFAMAGLWETQLSPDGSERETCTIITTESTGKVREIHHRMPVILPPQHFETWLDNANPRNAELQGLLLPFQDNSLSIRPVPSPSGF